ncbi:hypothetical protein HMPREF1640_03515 [Prevotella sp. S7-1-8]|uniref:hypothetical protein n=1 Tax=Prevotella sp. S7-1-8 TaxID=1284775 RepID=UPI00051011F4|nr:hypothetical protein [Prevotella sp. S7-1-8]KGF18511.1 hypothetical protein HMPREF1640_03515 [Prevotella sp. S7-1-8]
MTKEVSFTIKINSDGGVKKVTADAKEVGKALSEVQEEAEKAKQSVITWAQAAQAVDAFQNSIAQLQGVLCDLTQAYQVQLVAETQLDTIMRQRMGSTDAEIQSVKQLCAAQQELGVIGDEVQMSGAQQMATFLKQKQSLEVLIPAMNNLIAQQDGLNATTQDAVSVGNMMGKAMQGQAEVLQRVGITFDETQKQVLQYGNESERAAMLAEVITANVGNMNAQLAKTDAGKQKQLENTLGDIKEQLGSMVQGAMPFVTIAAQTMICLAATAKLITSIKALSAAFVLTSIKGLALAVHERVVATAQNLLAASGYTATAGTAALTVAVTALYAAMTMGISLIITGIISLFSSMGDEAEDAAQDVDMLKESTDAFSSASSNAKAEIDMEVSTLASLINSHKNTTKKVSELNKKYGESFGYHRTAAEWYDTLISKSKVYCAQIGYEAQAKVLASKIAAKQLEKESKQSERFQLGQQYWDGNGNTHYNWENAAGGKDYYEQLGGEVSKLTNDIKVLQRQYGACIKHMVDAQKELERSRNNVRVTDANIHELTNEELNQELEQKRKELDRVKGNDNAERQRLNREIGRLQKELNKRDAVNKREQGVAHTNKKTTRKTHAKQNAPEKPVENPKTLEQIAKNLSYYDNLLKKTDKDDKNKIASLTALIGKYKELQKAVQQEVDAASRPTSLDTLEDIDAQLLYQQQLRKQASKEKLSQIDAEIKRLNNLKTAFEDSSHAALKTDEIKTYEQLDEEIAFYEKQLKKATQSGRAEIQKHILALQKLRHEWDEALATLAKPAHIGTLNSMEELDKAISYYGALQRKASAQEVENIQRTINALQDKRDAMARMTQLPAMHEETHALGAMSGKKLRIELEVIGLEGIREKIRSLQKMLADTKNPLGAQQREEVKELIGTWKRYEKVLRRSQVSFTEAWGGIKGIGDGVQSLTNALEGNGDAWQTITGVVDAAIQIYQGLSGIIAIIDALTGATQQNTAATTAQGMAKTETAAVDSAATATEVTNSAARATAASAETTADVAGAAAKTMKAHASIPFAGIAIGIGMVAALIGVMASLPKFADGCIAYGPTLGIFGEYAGAANNPEVVVPLDRLKALIGDTGGGFSGRLEARLRGRDIVLALANETRVSRKKTNIRL